MYLYIVVDLLAGTYSNYSNSAAAVQLYLLVGTSLVVARGSSRRSIQRVRVRSRRCRCRCRRRLGGAVHCAAAGCVTACLGHGRDTRRRAATSASKESTPVRARLAGWLAGRRTCEGAQNRLPAATVATKNAGLETVGCKGRECYQNGGVTGARSRAGRAGGDGL